MTSAVLKRHIRERWTGNRAALFTKLVFKFKWAVVGSIPSGFVKIPLMWPETQPPIYDTRIGRKSREIRVRAHYLIALLSVRLIQCMQSLRKLVLYNINCRKKSSDFIINGRIILATLFMELAMQHSLVIHQSTWRKCKPKFKWKL